jgi:Tfp pilus assembly protein PilF
MDRGDRTGAQKALEEATVADPRQVKAHLILATFYSAAGDFEKAIDRYRRALAAEPNHVVALNDLAYALATKQSAAMPEALSLARKAHTLAGDEPAVTDTLAWVLHLSGNDVEARPLISTAATAAPASAEIQLHAAFIDSAVGAHEKAARELARALELSPDMEKRSDVAQLRATIERASKP